MPNRPVSNYNLKVKYIYKDYLISERDKELIENHYLCELSSMEFPF